MVKIKKPYMVRLLLLLFLLNISVYGGYSQNHRVGRNVVDSEGEPISGVNILEKDSDNNGTITDFNGDFSINVGTENSIFIFSFVGFESEAVAIEGRNELSVVL